MRISRTIVDSVRPRPHPNRTPPRGVPSGPRASRELLASLDKQEGGLDLYQELSRPDRTRFLRLAERAPQAQGDLAKLLASGTLFQKGSEGRSVLEYLSRLSTLDQPESLESDQGPLTELLRNLAEPEQIRQSLHNTCTVTTIEYLLAKEQPAEYSRLVLGLLGPDGQTQLSDGSSLIRPPSALAKDRGSRPAVSRIFQAAMMDRADGPLRYNNSDDSSSWRRFKRPWTGVANPIVFENLLTASLGREYETNLHLPGFVTGEHLSTPLHKLEKALEERAVPVSLRWGNSAHVLSVEEQLPDGRFVLRNPWGNSERAGDLQGYQVERKLLEETGPSGGYIVMEAAELQKSLLSFWTASR